MIDFGNLRIHIYSDTLFRIEYQPDRKFLHLPTLLMGKKLPSEISSTIKTSENTLEIQTKKCQLHYQKLGNRFDQDILEIRFLYGNEFRLWTPQYQHTTPIYEIWRSLDDWSRNVLRQPNPVIINKDGWHKIVDNSGSYWNDEIQWVTIQRPPYYENWYLFFYGDDPKIGFLDFIHLFGKPPLLPRQAFGAWYSRWYPFHQQELIELVKKYREHNIPLDVLVVDVDWHQEHWNGYDWRKDLFPNPQQFIQTIKDWGIRLVLNDHPGYENNDPLPENDSHLVKIKAELKEPPYKAMWACDWTRKSSVQAWANHCLKNILAQGIDWWWIDGWTDFGFLDIDSQYWVNWQYYEATKEFHPEKRALILSRWGGLGGHRYPIQFSGDTHSNFQALAREIEFTSYSGGVGANYWSHDIGGFHEGQIDEEVYLRWLQYGVFSPILRTHSNHGIREPFNFSNQALEISRRLINLRSYMIPYWEHLNHKYQKDGFPSILNMAFLNPQIYAHNQHNQQYLIGQEILVSPITASLQGNNKISKEVFLPEKRWLDTIDGKWKNGNCQVTTISSISHIPVFICSGAIIPTSPSNIPTGAYKELHIHLFGNITENEYLFSLDDGDTAEDSKEYRSTTLIINAQQKEKILQIQCKISENQEFLPQMLRFIYYPDQQNVKLLNISADENSQIYSLITKINEQTVPCLSWGINQKDLKPVNTFELEIQP